MATSLLEKLNLLRNNGITPKAAVYARFSSDNQREESIDAQLRAARDFAKNNGLFIIQEYIDKAKSATSDDRESFQQMIKDSSTGSFHFVLVHKYDRFARNRADSIGYRLELKKNGVSLVSVLESFDNETPEGALLEGVLESMNEFYSRNLAREVMKGLKENAYKALSNGGIAPYGYDVDSSTHKYIINPIEAEAVRLIFDMVGKHHSYGEVLDALNSKGYKSKTGGVFKRNSLHDILRNPRYTGLYTYMRRTPKNPTTRTRNSHWLNNQDNMISVPNGMPAIISQELFDNVQSILDSRKQTRRSSRNIPCLLSGKIQCGCCGSPYCVDRVKRKNGINYYVSYRCNNRKNKTGVICRNLSVSQEYLDEQITLILSEVLFNPSIIPRLIEKYNEALKESSHKNEEHITSLKQKINGKSRSISNILKALERTDSEELTEHLLKLEQEKKSLTKQLAEFESNTCIPAIDSKQLRILLEQAKLLFLNNQLEDSKRLVEIFVETVFINKDNIEIVLNQAPFIKDADYTKISYTIPRKAKK